MNLTGETTFTITILGEYKYKGQIFKATGKACGLGKATSVDRLNETYEGTWYENKRHGISKHIYAFLTYLFTI